MPTRDIPRNVCGRCDRPIHQTEGRWLHDEPYDPFAPPIHAPEPSDLAGPSQAPPTPDEGWGIIRPGDRKAHYYDGSFSLCGRVGFYAGSKDPDTGASPDDCAGCRKKLDAR